MQMPGYLYAKRERPFQIDKVIFFLKQKGDFNYKNIETFHTINKIVDFSHLVEFLVCETNILCLLTCG